MIELKDLSMGYGTHLLLKDVNVQIPDGQLTALIGRNGTGKSTLLRAIAGLNREYGGHIYVNGHDIASFTPAYRARQLAFVSTERTRIPNMRCADVVALGRAPYTNWVGQLQSQDKAMVEHALRAVDMLDYADCTINRMSDGECQRVMIARALAQDAPVILLDEPTSFLDLPNRYELCSLLGKLSHEEGKCILFSTHELDIALSLCDDIALIDTPYLHCLSTEKMRTSGYIDRLFRNDKMTFDASTSSIIMKK